MQLMRIALFIFVSLAFVACCGTQTTPDGDACQSCAENEAKFDYSCPLVTAPCSRARISEIDKILDGLFKEQKPVVLYVHGRGCEPKKTSEQGIITTLEKTMVSRS
jgi:hypothetical protein